MLQGDGNADGFGGAANGVPNDVVYVPKDANDITLSDPTQFQALDKLIRKDGCLRAQRGRLLERNSCRDPWEHETTARLSKRFRLADQRGLEVSADLLQRAEFRPRELGPVRQPVAGLGKTVPLLELVGYDEANGQPLRRR
ncbi:MAG: hypothetical protein ACREOQ_14265 [Gemmatimonadales bacterium]